jgi:phenylpyruvate tautomerase PptA (4-oxalocrotonate tautomerase family)
MPLAKIHLLEGRYSEERVDKVSAAIQSALINTLGIPPEDYSQLVFEFPKARFRHTPSFVGMHYTDDFIILDLIFIEGRPKETRLALPKDVERAHLGQGQSIAERHDDHALRSPGRKFLVRSGRGPANQRRPAQLNESRAERPLGGLFEYAGAAGLGAPVHVCVSQRDGEKTRIDMDQVTAFFSKFPEMSSVPALLDDEMVKVFEHAAA